MKGIRAKGYEDFFQADPPIIWGPMHQEGNPLSQWHIRPPCGHSGMLARDPDHPTHDVTENPDGTVTVAGSILCTQCGWHGYIEAGVWRSV